MDLGHADLGSTRQKPRTASSKDAAARAVRITMMHSVSGRAKMRDKS